MTSFLLSMSFLLLFSCRFVLIHINVIFVAAVAAAAACCCCCVAVVAAAAVVVIAAAVAFC